MKKYMKAGVGMVGLGVGLGVGSQVLGEMGSTVGQTAIGNISKAMPMMGNMVGAGMVMDSLSTMNKSAKKMMK